MLFTNQFGPNRISLFQCSKYIYCSRLGRALERENHVSTLSSRDRSESESESEYSSCPSLFTLSISILFSISWLFAIGTKRLKEKQTSQRRCMYVNTRQKYLRPLYCCFRWILVRPKFPGWPLESWREISIGQVICPAAASSVVNARYPTIGMNSKS